MTKAISSDTRRATGIAREILKKPEERPFLISCLALQIKVMRDYEGDIDGDEYFVSFEEIIGLYRL